MADRITIRPARLADLAPVDALLARSYPRQLAADYPPSVLVTALPLISRARPELLASGTYYVADDGAGHIVGAGGWTRTAPSGRAAVVGNVRHVVTDDRMTRRGIGRAIMARVFDDSAAAGCRHLDCLATRTAVPFYQALGFTVVGAVEITLRPGIAFPAIRMQRNL